MYSGYSGTPLSKKLGIKMGMRILLSNVPEYYDQLIDSWPDKIEFSSFNDEKQVDFIHFFCQKKNLLISEFPILKRRLKKDGICWVSWPKGKSKLSKDLNGNDVREVGLRSGLVDVKVCAVDEDWSGLKFMFKKTDR